jgi:hypothetical protein
MLSCTDCKSDRLVWDWASGDVVCTSCGLVVQERFIDDRVSFKDMGDYTPLATPVTKQILKKVDVVNANLFNGMLEGTTDVAKAIDEFCQSSPSDGDVLSKADVASGVFANTNGFSAKELCVAMDVKPRQLWKAVVKHKVINTNRTSAVLKRTIYECEDIQSGREWEVFKVAKTFLEALENNVLIQRIKSDKLVVSLMIIACEVVKLDVKRKELCRKYVLSLDTLIRHEALLQEALKAQEAMK